MFKSLAVGKIVETAEVFGQELSREFNKSRPAQATRDELALVFEFTLRSTATRLGTDTARDAVDKIIPRVRSWLGANR